MKTKMVLTTLVKWNDYNNSTDIDNDRNNANDNHDKKSDGINKKTKHDIRSALIDFCTRPGTYNTGMLRLMADRTFTYSLLIIKLSV